VNRKMKKIASSIIIVLLCVSMFTILTPQVKAQETIIFQDDFESYAVGTFPSAGGWEIVWNGAGNQSQVITDSCYASPTKSLQLVAINQWDKVEFAGVKKDFSSGNKIIGFEARLLATENSVGYVGFSNMQMGSWGRFYATIGLGNGSIFACERDNEYAHELQILIPNTWYKIRVVLDRSTSRYNVWIDDALREQDIPIYYDPWEILSLQLFVAVDKQYFDDVKIFEVTETPSLNGLVGYWKFDEGSGSTVVDISGNGNTGTLNSGPVWVDGKFGKALSFDGVDDHVQVPQSSSLDVTDQISVETWVYPRAYVDNTGMVSHIISRCDYSGGHIYVLSMYPDSNKISFSINPYPDEYPSVADLPLNAWTHLAMTYDGSYVRLYINGEFDSSYAQSGPIYTTSNWLAFGCKPTGPWGGVGTYAYFNGMIDEVRIYDRALSQQEIQTDMGGLPPAEHDFSMRWNSPFYGVTAGHDTFFVIYLEYSEGFDETVTLSVQGLPDGCTAWFDVDTLRPPVSYRTLHITTPSTLNNGTYIFMVKGDSSDSYQMIPVTLTIGTGKITGVVYRDDNGNGVRDSGEPTVSGATLGYYATQNYIDLYSASATSNSVGEFTLANVPFNVANEITATATGLTQRCIPVNIMNQLETHVDVGIKPPTILYKPVVVDGCKYQLKLLYGESGQITGGFVLNLSDTNQPSYVDPTNPANDNYAMGITKRVIRAMLIQELATDMININALPYQQIFGQSPQLETWLSHASSTQCWYALAVLSGFSVTLDDQGTWNRRLFAMIEAGIRGHTSTMFPDEWTLTQNYEKLIAHKDWLLATPGFDSALVTVFNQEEVLFWAKRLEYLQYSVSLANLLVIRQMIVNEAPRLAEIQALSDQLEVSDDMKNALAYCASVREQYESDLGDHAMAIASEFVWSEAQKVGPSKILEYLLPFIAEKGLISIGIAVPFTFCLATLKLLTYIYYNFQQAYDCIRNADAGRIIIKDLQKVLQAYSSELNAATETTEKQTESLNLVMMMQYSIAEKMCYFARSMLRNTVIGADMDLIDPSWRALMAVFEAKEKWAKGYFDFINQRLKDDVNEIASKITVPSHAIGFVLHSPANFCVVDPQGRRVGFDSQTVTTINEISTAVYTGPNSEPQVISIESPSEGAYHVVLTGTDTGSYTLDIELITPTQTITETCSGFIEPNEIKTHHIFIPESGDTIIVDDTPPTTKLTTEGPKYTNVFTTYVTRETLFTLESDDGEGSGVSSTTYRIFNNTYDTGWILYSSPFYLTLLGDGTYTIAFNSTDNAGNVEPANTIQVTLFSWTYIFTDSYSRGTTLKINTQYKLFQFIAPDKDFGIKHDAKMIQLKHVIIVCFEDREMGLVATAVDDKIDFCSAIAWDKTSNKKYLLIDKPNCR
jgi:hypothetical protein